MKRFHGSKGAHARIQQVATRAGKWLQLSGDIHTAASACSTVELDCREQESSVPPENIICWLLASSRQLFFACSIQGFYFA